MLNSTGILGGNFAGNTQYLQQRADHSVPVQSRLCNLSALVGQMDGMQVIHCDISVFYQPLEINADGGPFYVQFRRQISTPHLSGFGKLMDPFQIILPPLCNLFQYDIILAWGLAVAN